MKVKFGGMFTMKKLVEIVFKYEDGTSDGIIDPRATLLFQSRCNTSGVLSGMEDYIVTIEPGKVDVQ
jgi:hypothetical protein